MEFALFYIASFCLGLWLGRGRFVSRNGFEAAKQGAWLIDNPHAPFTTNRLLWRRQYEAQRKIM